MFTSLAEKGIVKVKKKIAIIILGLTVALSVGACGKEDNSTELNNTVDVKENINTEEDTSKEKDSFGQSVQLTGFDEISNYTDKIDANSIKGIHLDDLTLTKDEFALTNKDDYDTVLAKVSEGKDVEEDIAGNIKIKFSDFELEYTKSYQNDNCVGIAVSVAPLGDNCKGFYIECEDSDWYIEDNFLIYSEYPDYSEILEEIYGKTDVNEEKLSGEGIVGIWYEVETWSCFAGGNCAYIFYNDNTVVAVSGSEQEMKHRGIWEYEIIDDENMIIDEFPNSGGEGFEYEYVLDGDSLRLVQGGEYFRIFRRIK